MDDAIFLSAGVPDPKRGPEYAATANSVAIAAAVAGLLHVTLGRRPLVWGGQPAITPMVWAAAENFGVEYRSWVKLYQTEWFQDEYPEDNARFRNVVYTPRLGTLADSLREMRLRMFKESRFAGAVFIGGVGGIIDECELFRELQPNARIVPVYSTGGAALALEALQVAEGADLKEDLDYVGLLHRRLAIPVQERRYATPAEQPHDLRRRLRGPPPRGPA